MAATLSSAISGLTPVASAALSGMDAKTARAKATGENFEAVFLNSMFQQMFSGIGQGPFSGGPGAQVWQSFLTDEYAKSFVKAGGIGIGNQIQRELLALQEVR